jgi:hypothetical protein
LFFDRECQAVILPFRGTPDLERGCSPDGGVEGDIIALPQGGARQDVAPALAFCARAGAPAALFAAELIQLMF